MAQSFPESLTAAAARQLIARKTESDLETQEGSMNGQLKSEVDAFRVGEQVRHRHFLFFAIAMAGVILVGCGRSDQPGSGVVPPPAPVASDSSTTPSNSEPPGGIELPEGPIPVPTEQESSSSKGLEMPNSVEAPADANGNTDSQSKIKYGTWEEIQTVAKTSGRITVVDLWSLACEPCLKEFPGLVRLHEMLGPAVQCIAVDLDFDGRQSRPPEYYEQRVADFLDSVGAPDFPTYISRTPSDDVYAATKLASIPAVLIYNADGEIVKVFVDAGDTVGFSYDKDVIPLVKKLAG